MLMTKTEIMNNNYSSLPRSHTLYENTHKFTPWILTILFIVITIPSISYSAHYLQTVPKKSSDQRCIIIGLPSTVCNIAGSIFNNGKGNSRRKKIGGNSLRVSLKNLQKYYLDNKRLKGYIENWHEASLRIHKKSGRIKHISIHARNKKGNWKLIYKGKRLAFPLNRFRKFWLDSNYTDLIISLNGAYERFDPVKATANVSICTTDATTGLLGLPPCDRDTKKKTAKTKRSFIGKWRGTTWCTSPKREKKSFGFDIWIKDGIIKCNDHSSQNIFRPGTISKSGKLHCSWYRKNSNANGTYTFYINSKDQNVLHGHEYTRKIKCKKYRYKLRK